VLAFAGAVVALITHDVVEHDAEGVTHTTHWQERLTRDGDQCWIERVGASTRPAASVHEIDLRIAARWYTRDGEQLVSVPDKTIIDVDHPDETYATACALVDVTGLSPTSGPAVTHARWLGATNAREFVRVAWRSDLDLPAVIERGTWNGRVLAHTTITPQRFVIAPWSSLVGFRHLDVSDLED